MNYTTTVDEVEVWITLREIKEAVEDFDDDSKEELIEHLQELLKTNPIETSSNEYLTTVDDIEVEVDVDEDELSEEHVNRLLDEASNGKIIVDAPTLAIQMELEECIKAVLTKHGLKAEDHIWGV